MLRKSWSTRARIVLLFICLLNFKLTKTELYRTGCLFNSDLCNEKEYCYNDSDKGVCLLDSRLGNDDDEVSKNENILNNFNDDEKLSRSNSFLDDCIRIADLKNSGRKRDFEPDAYSKLLSNLCENIILKGNEPEIPLIDSNTNYLSSNNQFKSDDPFVIEPNSENSKDATNLIDTKNYPALELASDDDNENYQTRNEDLNNNDENFQTGNENSNYDENKGKNLDDIEIFAPKTIDKKLDQKKPGPLFKQNRFVFDDGFDEKRFDGIQINEKYPNEDNSQFDDDYLNEIYKRKNDFSNPTPPADHKPVEEGAVRVELDKEKKIQLVEPTEPDEKGIHSPFVAVDSSYAYIFFIKGPKQSNLGEKDHQIVSEEELMALDDILARKKFVDGLQKNMMLPKGSFSDLKLDSRETKELSDCVPFSFMKYFIIFNNDENDCNCKLLIASFKVNPNVQQLNASLVADRIEQYQVDLEKETGLFVIETGIGDKVKIERKRNCKINLFSTFINLSLFAIAAILVVLLVILFQRKEYLRQKIYNATCGAPVITGWFSGEKDFTQSTLSNLANKSKKLSKADLEKQSLDYQDLCRQRMKTNDQNKKLLLNKDKIDEMKMVYQANNNSPTIEKCRTQQKASNQGTSIVNDPLISTAMNMDISTGHLILEYMENHLKQNGDKLNREWNALCNLATDDYLESTQNAAKLAANKNRYPNDPSTWPFDSSRVLLNDLESKDQIDYINASTIIDSDPNPIYIATQGPLKETISDFWQMVWQQGSSVIVILTRLVENGKEQSARYWPEKGSEKYLHFEVNLVSEHIWSEQYLVRSLYLKNLLKNETRTVTLFHFFAWPENSVPSSPATLLEFRRKVNKSYREKSSPIIVHCSDGCNRTGAYILIDMVLNRLTKGVKEIDLAATLEHLRYQRPSMIRNKETFEFCLKSIAEEVSLLMRSLQK